MTITDEDEKRAALIMSLIDLNGSASKKKVLDNIYENKYIDFSPDDLKLMKNRKEDKWRNDLAFVRKHLVLDKYMDGNQFDVWKLTESGREYFYKLTKDIKHIKGFRILSSEGIARIQQIVSSIQAIKYEDLKVKQISEKEPDISEGSYLELISHKYERDSSIKNLAIKIHGLNCQACGFNFEMKYGRLGKDFIEIHHKNPLGQIKQKHIVDPKTDIAVLCSNCHRMVHRERENILSVAELKSILK
jgi:predicted HNH restriction endonuclease